MPEYWVLILVAVVSQSIAYIFKAVISHFLHVDHVKEVQRQTKVLEDIRELLSPKG